MQPVPYRFALPDQGDFANSCGAGVHVEGRIEQLTEQLTTKDTKKNNIDSFLRYITFRRESARPEDGAAN